MFAAVGDPAAAEDHHVAVWDADPVGGTKVFVSSASLIMNPPLTEPVRESHPVDAVQIAMCLMFE
jgi:hypothetical protein